MRAPVLVVAALLSSAPALAETYVVSPTGNDAAAGSAAAPWKTLQFAADKVKAGDIVNVKKGDYAGFRVKASGRAGAEIAFVAEAGVRITSFLASGDGINVEGDDADTAFVRIQGFTVNGSGHAGIRVAGVFDDVANRNTCNHVTVRGNHLDANRNWGVFTTFCDDLLIEGNEASHSVLEHGIYTSNSGDRPVVRGNTLFGNHANGLHMNGDISQGGDGIITGALVEANVIFDNGEGGGSGINGDGIQSAVIRNNLLFGNHSAGISLYDEDGGAPSKGNLVVNNTLVMAADARWAINIQNGSTGNRVVNNVLMTAHPTRGAFDVCPTCLAGMQSDFNLGTARFTSDGGDSIIDAAAWRVATGLDAHFAAATPAAVFVVAAGTQAADFALRDGSPAIDKGGATDAATTDLAGNPRPQGAAVDIGALERCEGACMEPPPGPPDAGPVVGGRPDAGAGPGPGEPDARPGAPTGAIAVDGEVTGGCCQAGASGSVSLLLSGAVLAVIGRRRARRARRAPPGV